MATAKRSTGKRKNSLVENINRRKRAGTSRSKRKSTVSKKAYRNMQRGWPKTARKKSTRSRKSS
ncbi:hypothetical protein [Hyalangium rubrum]|uniref:Uncharacterized protein n=1 Tax=Hyalangium rubrum TaxID=3103134 RepID=A0ABU5HGM0_9BACT|nr:hypothetical protein [Hyalangium sp. s54d21]MDY7231988.1 hypothetical protein [Hyalangium sp. s54d21]